MVSIIDNLRYPVGNFRNPETFTDADIKEWTDILRHFPGILKSEVSGLNDKQLDTPYRDGGWTVRQVVHHLADSHMNAYIRMKLSLTEDNPTIKPYYEDRWAELKDGRTAPVNNSLMILEGLHQRMDMMFSSLTTEQLERTFFHPETKITRPLKTIIALYAWHSRHHLAHITELKKRMGW